MDSYGDVNGWVLGKVYFQSGNTLEQVPWNREQLSLVFNKHGDDVLRDTVSGYGGNWTG